MELPSLVPIRQTLPQPVIVDVAAEARRVWRTSGVLRKLQPGDRVAVGVGSRGVANLALLVRATIDALQEAGAKPFVVAAMGSHGGATAEGQRQILTDYGVSEAALGVPVKTDMDAVPIGTNRWGEPVYWARNALEADAVVTVSRVKPHTDFRGRHESGIAKMLAIGLGKREGAAQHHRWGVRGLRERMPESARVIVERTRFLAGLAVLENAQEQTAVLNVVGRDELFEREPALLEQAMALLGRLPVEQLDLLVIGEIGKNYSGAGVDPLVVGRLLVEGEPELSTPRITRICALDLSPESHGNGTGIGIADLTTERLLTAIDPVPFRMNNLTACFLWRSKLPLGFANDRACIEAGLATCWQPDRAAVRLAVIPNTLELAELWVSPAVLGSLNGREHVKVVGEERPMPFDAAGDLQQDRLFPHSVRGRRSQAARSRS
jgi:hypothetical protein